VCTTNIDDQPDSNIVQEGMMKALGRELMDNEEVTEYCNSMARIVK